MHRYYTFQDGVALVWQPGQVPLMYYGPERITQDRLRMLFELPEPMVYVPLEAVSALTNGY